MTTLREPQYTLSDLQGESGPHLISQCSLPLSNDCDLADTDDQPTESETNATSSWPTRPAPLLRISRAQTVPFLLPSFSFTDLSLASRRRQVRRIRSSPFVFSSPTVVRDTQMDEIEVELGNMALSSKSSSSIDPTLNLIRTRSSADTRNNDEEDNDLNTFHSSLVPEGATVRSTVERDSIPKIATCCFCEEDIESCITTSTTSGNVSVCSSSQLSHGVRDEPERGPHMLSFEDEQDDDASHNDHYCWEDLVICPSPSVIYDQKSFPNKKQRQGRYGRKVIGYVMFKLNNWCSK